MRMAYTPETTTSRMVTYIIEDGDNDISVGDDAMHAEGLLIITGGDIDVAASDDGFNAAGGSSGSSGDNKGGSSHGAGDNKEGFG